MAHRTPWSATIGFGQAPTVPAPGAATQGQIPLPPGKLSAEQQGAPNAQAGNLPPGLAPAPTTVPAPAAPTPQGGAVFPWIRSQGPLSLVA